MRCLPVSARRTFSRCRGIPRRSDLRSCAVAGARAFTLLEIMIVVGIMGIILTMGVPLVWKVWHKAPMAKAIKDVVEVCSNARRQAILQGRQVDLVLHPRDGRLEVGSAAAPAPAAAAQEGGPAAPVQLNPQTSAMGLAAQLPPEVRIEELDINKMPGGFRDAEIARVRFFPNGTSDEMSLFLLSERNERCEILLEVTTGLTSVEWDVRRFR